MKSLKSPSIKDFPYIVDKFGDITILRYRVPDLESLSVKQQELFYYLIEAALHGYDIVYDQNGKYNLLVRRVLESIYTSNKVDKTSEQFKLMEIYLKKVWVGNGIYQKASCDKFIPEFSEEYFKECVNDLPEKIFKTIGVEKEEVLNILVPLIFNPELQRKKTNKSLGIDVILASSVNYYENVNQVEVENFYKAKKNQNDKEPNFYGLNSKLIRDKKNNKITEKVYKLGGMYTKAIEHILFWLKKALNVAENPQQKKVIELLISFYQTGDLNTFIDYSINWIKDTDSLIDFVNGFIETYEDPLGFKGAWESLVNFKSPNATERTDKLTKNAQWFEDNSPVDQQFKKPKVKGIIAKVITAGILAGRMYPLSPTGINLPNSSWIRANHGSKSVTIENIKEAYEEAFHEKGLREEFVWSKNEINLLNKYSFICDNLHTDLHECLGHASGQLLPGVDVDSLKNYKGAIEEGRADLFALYYIADNKIIELGLLPDKEAFKARYYNFFMNGLLTQQFRVELGKDVEEVHMRNRYFISQWVLNRAKNDHAVEIKERNGKHFVVINDYLKVRHYISELLAEVQRIKSTGDFKAAKDLVENYGVKLDRKLHQEIIERYKNIIISPIKGFVNPVYKPFYDRCNRFSGITIDYTEGFAEQHLRYSKYYSHLPTFN